MTEHEHTLEEIEADPEYRTYEVAKVIDDMKEHDGFELRLTDNGAIFVPNPKNLPLPVPGEQTHFYGRGFGYPVRGIVCGERVYYYRTEQEDRERHRQEVEEMNQKKRDEFEANKLQWEQDLFGLPQVFKDRINRFMERDPNWGWNFGPYEMFCCKEAVKIATKLTTPEALQKFHKAEWEEQKKIVPDLEYDQHSGNTFGASVMLANVYLQDKSLLPKVHGALCPLVGCQDYGCYAAGDTSSGQTETDSSSTS